MVYAMPLYHPLRLIEEICMLDQMSGGRLDIGFGRGASPIEMAYFGEDPAKAQEVYAEGVEMIIKGLTEKMLDLSRQAFNFDDVPMEIEPLQRPYPPIWYGVHMPESAERAARRGLQLVSLDPPAETRLSMRPLPRGLARTQPGDAPLPKLGLGRFIVVGADRRGGAGDRAARLPALASRASRICSAGTAGRSRIRARATFDLVMERGQGVAGSPETVAAALGAQLTQTGCNYMVGQFTFGDLTSAECLRSIGLFADEVMPALRHATAAAGMAPVLT